MKRFWIFYLALTVFTISIYWMITYCGNHVYSDQYTLEISSGIITGILPSFQNAFSNPRNRLDVLLLQITVITVFARFMGFLFQRMKQPVVIGEILAGIVLGPSVLGHVYPEAMRCIFPADSMSILYLLSQVGLILFMFVIGMELDWEYLRKSAKEAILISYSGLIFPFILGVILSFFLYSYFMPVESSFTAFALFIGTAMCITAFPVLARIVHEKQLIHSPVGKLAIAAAAIGDVSAWCILAVVTMFIRAGTLSTALIIMCFLVIYVIVMIFVIRPFIRKVVAVCSANPNIKISIIATIFILMVFSAFISQLIGIHALFGAFMAGVIVPNNADLKRAVSERLQDVALFLLLPLFFVETGLRTELGLITTLSSWLVCAGIVVTAILGKVGGTLMGSRYAGLPWDQSLTLGVLMNSRGLMELVVINIGYEMRILPSEIYSMFVIMTLVTTFITGPGLMIVGYTHPLGKKAGAG